MVDLGGEVVNARQTIPRVLLLGILIAVAINLSILTVTAGVADTMALEGKTLVEVAANFMSTAQLGYFVVAGALLACATSINTVFTLVARALLVISTEGLLPRFLSRVDIERGSPVGGLTLAYVLAALALLSQSSLLFFGTLTNFPNYIGRYHSFGPGHHPASPFPRILPTLGVPSASSRLVGGVRGGHCGERDYLRLSCQRQPQGYVDLCWNAPCLRPLRHQPPKDISDADKNCAGQG